ncbi:hypothetical protein I4U23_011710 [Adineta vaga]|nr:hypothetical protein I4U23_011710 [Adineta vaga]
MSYNSQEAHELFVGNEHRTANVPNFDTLYCESNDEEERTIDINTSIRKDYLLNFSDMDSSPTYEECTGSGHIPLGLCDRAVLDASPWFSDHHDQTR